jgi:hypothetical protein
MADSHKSGHIDPTWARRLRSAAKADQRDSMGRAQIDLVAAGKKESKVLRRAIRQLDALAETAKEIHGRVGPVPATLAGIRARYIFSIQKHERQAQVKLPLGAQGPFANIIEVAGDAVSDGESVDAIVVYILKKLAHQIPYGKPGGPNAEQGGRGASTDSNRLRKAIQQAARRRQAATP